MAASGIHPPKGHRRTARWSQHEGTVFTVREVETLRLMCEGFAQKQVALLMGVSLETVKSNVKEARARWEKQGRPAGNVALMMRRCIEDGLIDPILPLGPQP